MQLLTGHRPPSSGRVEVFGARPHEDDDVLRRICFIKEGQRYPDHFRVRDALHGASLLFPDRDRELAEDLLAEFGVPAGRPIKKLTRGMDSAAGIIIGLASRAVFPLIDEPYAGLDVVAQHQFYDRLLADYAEQPRTILISTHLIGEIADLPERVLLLDHGRLLLETDAGSVRGSAVTVRGPVERIQAFAGGHELLHQDALAGTGRAVVRLRAEGEEPEAYGLPAEPTNLQELVVAMSLTTPGAAGTRSPSTDTLQEVPR